LRKLRVCLRFEMAIVRTGSGEAVRVGAKRTTRAASRAGWVVSSAASLAVCPASQLVAAAGECRVGKGVRPLELEVELMKSQLAQAGSGPG
jgi:hypothetical protein